MQNKSIFIGNHPSIVFHQYLSNGTANPGNRNKVKLRRTYGWHCPFDKYKSNKRFNVQRHINSVHGWGSGAPVDSKTGETMEDKVRNASLQRNFQNTLAPPYSHSNSIGSTRQDREFGGNTGEKENQSTPPAALLSPAQMSNVRMPFSKSQEESVPQLRYGPPSERNNYHGQTNRLTPYYEQNAYSSRAGNHPNASKVRDGNASYWDRVDLNGLQSTQENLSTNSLTAYHTYPSVPFNPNNFILTQMQQLLDLFKQG
jgi:hypothetical protein